MQKISSYLYPNRINVVADLAAFSVRWNIVYQNRIKIYKGVDNLLTLDVKNAEQKRIDISLMTLKMSVTDVNDQEIGVFDITPDPTKLGLATVNIANDALIYIEPQFLNFTIYRENIDSTKTIFYADTQFGAVGNMEVVGSAVAVGVPTRYITRFLPKTNESTQPPFAVDYISDAVDIIQPNLLKDPSTDSTTLNFIIQNLDADITIQFTKEAVISSSTTWTDIETFTVNNTVSTISKTYTDPNYNREYTWARVKYRRLLDSTGKIDKVLLNFD